MTGEDSVSSLRITIPLDQSHPAQNIFNYAQLKAKHVESIQQRFQVTEPTPVTSEVDVIHMESEEEEEEQKTKRNRKINPEDEYDVNDDWVDDSELFQTETDGNVAPIWEYGFFAWRGPIDTLFQQKYFYLIQREETSSPEH
jgi:agmatine/peptidylarginine deiminase